MCWQPLCHHVENLLENEATRGQQVQKVGKQLPDVPASGLKSRHPCVPCVLSHFSCVQLFATPWTVAHQAPLSMGFSWQEYWSGWPCLPPWDLPNSGFEPISLTSPALADRFFTTSATWKTPYLCLATSKVLIA